MGCHFLLQGIFSTQGSNPCLLHCQADFLPLSHSEVHIYIYMGFSVVLAVQSCLTPCDPMDCSPPGSPVHGVFQARTLEWVAISFSMGFPVATYMCVCVCVLLSYSFPYGLLHSTEYSSPRHAARPCSIPLSHTVVCNPNP